MRMFHSLFLFSRSLWLALALMLALPGTAAAERGEDDGDYQILQASYGTAQRHVDVTQRLKELARQDRRFRLVNELFGVDPAPGETKTLRIYTRGRDGDQHVFEYREHGDVDGSQFTGWGGGNWGQGGWQGGWGDGPVRPGASAWGHGHGQSGQNSDDGEYQILQASYGTERHHVDVTPRLKQLARQDRRFKLENNVFGVDPDPGRNKILRIYAHGRDGQTRIFDYPEYSHVDGNQFTGWGGGNWGHGGWQGGWGQGAGNDSAYNRGDLRIISARYGVGRQTRDVTDSLQSQMRRDRLDVEVSNRLFGFDPAPGERKTLWITYSVGGGRTQEVRVEERDRARLP